MDRYERTSNIIKALYEYKKTLDAANFIKEVCCYFDYIKNEKITEPDMNLLLYLANQAGIPQYYDLLKEKFTDCRISDENTNVLTVSSLLYNSSLFFGNQKAHRYQKEIIERFSRKVKNRYMLTAPTSFGKTFLVYEIIKRMNYHKILLIFPTISLLSENYSRIQEIDFLNDYSIHSLSEETFDEQQNNIFIFTPERFLSFLDRNKNVSFDFAFVDEVYKIDNSFLDDTETIAENERDIAYRIALEYICGDSKDVLLAGPYMSLPSADCSNSQSLSNFLNDNEFSILDYNKYEIVTKKTYTIKSKEKYFIDNIEINNDKSKYNKIANIIISLSSLSENTIIYCNDRASTESNAKKLIENSNFKDFLERKCHVEKDKTYEMFLEHLQNTFGNDWIVLKALKNRIGIHHGLIPKYIQKEIINLFNSGQLICIFSTTTITEGVNTSAKNIIISSGKKGRKKLRQFDAKNIAGRAGRFYQHYSGRVIDLNNGFEEIILENSEVLGHKNYDVESQKSDIDFQITKEKYLSKEQEIEKKSIDSQILASGIPNSVINSFKVIGPIDKLKLFNSFYTISEETIREIETISIMLRQSNYHKLYLNGFQSLLDIIYPIIKEKNLKQLINMHVGEKGYSLITIKLQTYLAHGLLGLVEYSVTRKDNPKTKDTAMRDELSFVYNILKYHLVKYLGVFDILFKYYLSLTKKRDIDEISGLGMLLNKLEYNAVSSRARKVSDYGVPFKIVEYYDSQRMTNKNDFDPYERYIDNEVIKLLKE